MLIDPKEYKLCANERFTLINALKKYVNTEECRSKSLLSLSKIEDCKDNIAHAEGLISRFEC